MACPERLHNNIADHINKELETSNTGPELIPVINKHKLPANVRIPDFLYPKGEGKDEGHERIQKLNRRALYAVGKAGSRMAMAMANQEISLDDAEQSKDDVKDAITLMAAASHTLHSYQTGNEVSLFVMLKLCISLTKVIVW